MFPNCVISNKSKPHITWSFENVKEVRKQKHIFVRPFNQSRQTSDAICPSFCPSVIPSVFHSPVCHSVLLYFRPSDIPSFCHSVLLSFRPSVVSSVFLFIILHVCSSFCLLIIPINPIFTC